MRASLIVLWLLIATPGGAEERAAAASAEHRQAVMKWREQRLARLTSETGWLTLVGLFRLKPGENTYGSGHRNAIVLDHPQLARQAGAFTLTGTEVRFAAAAGSDIRLDGKPVESLALSPDTSGAPTVLSSGTLRFYVIERAGRLGVRVRDVAHPLRTQFTGLEYFPIDDEWAVRATFHAYEPAKRVPVVNVLGMVEDMQAPGYLTFTVDGQEWRLDALLEEEGDGDQRQDHQREDQQVGFHGRLLSLCMAPSYAPETSRDVGACPPEAAPVLIRW